MKSWNLITFFNSVSDEDLIYLALVNYEQLESLCYMLTLSLALDKQEKPKVETVH